MSNPTMIYSLVATASAPAGAQIGGTITSSILPFSAPPSTTHTTSFNGTNDTGNAQIAVLSHVTDMDNVAVLSKPKGACLGPMQMMNPEVIADCKQLSAMHLRKKYRKEANSHRCMLGRVKTKNAIVHPDFKEFRDFLRLVGPVPTKTATLDRINNADPEYAPGKVRWADKHTQNSNKSDSLVFHDAATGQYFTATQLATKQNVTADTIRKRRKRGWTDQEIISGKVVAKTVTLPIPGDEHGPIFANIQPVLAKWFEDLVIAKKCNDVHEQIRLLKMKARYDDQAAFYKKHRKDNPTAFEPLLNDPDTINWNEYHSDSGLPITYECWLEMFREDWRLAKNHAIFERCSPFHQAQIKKIDPEYVWRHRQAQAQKAKCLKKQ
jgi:hypothetical protein